MKYDWSKVDKEITSIATDLNGRIKGFESHSPMLFSSEPNMGSNKDGSRGQFTASYYWHLKSQKPYQGDWKDSLEQRPK